MGSMLPYMAYMDPMGISVYWHCIMFLIYLGKFHHDLTVTEPWKNG